MARRGGVAWSEKQCLEWKAKLSDITLLSKESDEDWGWILYLKDGLLPSEQLVVNAERLVDYARVRPVVQKAMKALDGPNVHHPALYWALWQAIEFDGDNSYEEIKKRPKFAEILVRQIRTSARKQIKLTDAIAGDAQQYETIALPWKNGWVQAKIGEMRTIATSLQKCADEIESINRAMLCPKDASILHLSEKKRKNIHDLFFMSKAMLGKCRWQTISTLLNAISSIEGRPDPKEFCGENMKKVEKYFRSSYQDLLPHFDQSRIAIIYEFNMQRILYQRKCGEISDRIDIDTLLSKIMLRHVPVDLRDAVGKHDRPGSCPDPGTTMQI